MSLKVSALSFAILLQGIGILLLSTITQAETVTLQYGLNGYTNTIDTCIINGAGNGGNNPSMNCGEGGRAVLIKFAVFTSEGGPIPNGAKINSATLELYKSNSTSSLTATFEARRLVRSWLEMEATWLNATNTTAWSAAGALGNGTDVNSTADGQGLSPGAPGWLTINVTSSVQSFAAAAQNHGWRVAYVSGHTVSKVFKAREENTAAQRPKLTINYSLPQLSYIHTDHLNTPRLITNQVGQAVWRYDNNDPFGGNVPDENPSSLGAFEFPLRDEGTYFDKETNLLYNWYRYRDLASGRFIQADPLGLAGGDLSLYVLRRNNPLSFTDPTGELVFLAIPVALKVIAFAAGVGAVSGGVGNYINQRYVQNNCDFDQQSFWLAVGFGGLAGAALPFAPGVGGAIAVGATANVLQYGTGQALSGQPITGVGIAANAATGVLGGAAGGTFRRVFPYGNIGTAASPAMVSASNANLNIATNSGTTNLVRNVGGGVLSNFDPAAPINVPPRCGCN
jgi:RHS repeat-associated protein